MALAYEEVTENITGAAIAVNRELGPGLLESTYEEYLCCEFSHRNISFRRQLPLPVTYRGIRLDCGYQIDVLVEQLVVIELKSVSS